MNRSVSDPFGCPNIYIYINLRLFLLQPRLLLLPALGHRTLISPASFIRIKFTVVSELHPACLCHLHPACLCHLHPACLSQRARLLPQSFIKPFLTGNRVQQVRRTAANRTLKPSVVVVKTSVDFSVFAVKIPLEWLRHYSDCKFNEQRRNADAVWNWSLSVTTIELNVPQVYVCSHFFSNFLTGTNTTIRSILITQNQQVIDHHYIDQENSK